MEGVTCEELPVRNARAGREVAVSYLGLALQTVAFIPSLLNFVLKF